jgi:hypothetical protein
MDKEVCLTIMQDTGNLERIMFSGNEERIGAHREQWLGISTLTLDKFINLSVERVASYHNHLLRSI